MGLKRATTSVAAIVGAIGLLAAAPAFALDRTTPSQRDHDEHTASARPRIPVLLPMPTSVSSTAYSGARAGCGGPTPDHVQELQMTERSVSCHGG